MGKKKDRDSKKKGRKQAKDSGAAPTARERSSGRGGDGKREDRATKKALRKQRNKAKHATDAQRLREQLEQQGLVLDAVKPDGNCLFRSISKQITGTEEHHARYRAQAIEYMRVNRPDFEFFVEDDEPWEDYLTRISSDREWGGNLELKALSDVLRVSFVIHQLDAPRFVMQCQGQPTRSVHLGYSGMMHYDSVKHSSDSSGPGQPAMRFEMGDAVAALHEEDDNRPKPITGLERRVMQETGCPHLEYVRAMLRRFNGVADAAVEELTVELAMADFSWDRAIELWNLNGTNDAGSGFQTFLPASKAAAAAATQAAENESDVNYRKTVDNVKMITGCPSFQLCRKVLDDVGGDVGAAVQELQTIFVMGGEVWPTDEQLNQAEEAHIDDPDGEGSCEMWLVDESASKNTEFFFGSGFGIKDGFASEQRVWRRIDLPRVSNMAPGLDAYLTARSLLPSATVDPQDDEEEVYGRNTGTMYFEVAQIVKDDDEQDNDGSDDDNSDGNEDDDDEVVVPWSGDDPFENESTGANDGGGGTAKVSSTHSHPKPSAVKATADRRRPRTISRNKPCPCGSKLKYKACCHPGVRLRRQRRLERLRGKHGDDFDSNHGGDSTQAHEDGQTLRVEPAAEIQVIAI
eukprot:INCI13939.1.p1 GENE.INCI13939.1~~INCI13939.1.p1  ORF type:complete len:632 (+),score=143.46 INCI13939.1:58-1953(+)